MWIIYLNGIELNRVNDLNRARTSLRGTFSQGYDSASGLDSNRHLPSWQKLIGDHGVYEVKWEAL